ncbi:MAG TPA: biopolymer transporter ExbD [Chthoniobacter sp.]|nr:biopolymer transporter ExbD [Chthoniobacter sp.]
MKLTRTLKFNPALFGVIPLINVIFLVVLFFTLSSRFVLQPGLAVTLPASSFTLGPRVDAQIVSVTAAPVPVIYHRDQRVNLDELRQRLAETKVRERSLIIKADKGTPYDLVVRITDEALKLGFSVILATDVDRK